MTVEEHVVDRDQDGKEINIQLDSFNGMRILELNFPVPNKPLTLGQLIDLCSRVDVEMIEYINTHRPPQDVYKAAEVLAKKMREVLTKHYKSMGFL